jgi:hypothetical protein
VKIPNADKVVIAKDKLCDYLLNPFHRRGGSKARLLISMGYSGKNWKRLEANLRLHHLAAEVVCETDSDYGKRYEIVAPLPDSSGGHVLFRSIWQIDTGSDFSRLITMYPE